VSPRERWDALRERRLARRLAGRRLLRAFARSYPDAFFIQIGANDGVEHDPLASLLESTSWSGILVEPVPEVFERLRRTHAHRLDRLVLENVAIADHDGSAAFYHLGRVEGDRVRRLDVFGSLSVEAVERSAALFVPGDLRRIQRSEVSCLSFASLCRRHRVERIDLLLIDVEGYDHEILKQIDFDAYRPRVVVYEHLFLSPRDRDQCRRRMEGTGYETMAEQRDTWCLDTSVDDQLTRVWGGLTPAAPAHSIHANT
jgi:FkbM family methyltransferase